MRWLNTYDFFTRFVRVTRAKAGVIG